jgi:tRNA uridine 5-carboxymethylaminomethyl modification enzyme
VRLRDLGLPQPAQRCSLTEFLQRPEVAFSGLGRLYPHLAELPRAVAEEVEIQVKYAGYLRKQEEMVRRFRDLEDQLIPDGLDYNGIPGLSNEVREKLGSLRPRSLGQAARLAGITPAAISVLMLHLHYRRER